MGLQHPGWSFSSLSVSSPCYANLKASSAPSSWWWGPHDTDGLLHAVLHPSLNRQHYALLHCRSSRASPPVTESSRVCMVSPQAGLLVASHIRGRFRVRGLPPLRFTQDRGETGRRPGCSQHFRAMASPMLPAPRDPATKNPKTQHPHPMPSRLPPLCLENPSLHNPPGMPPPPLQPITFPSPLQGLPGRFPWTAAWGHTPAGAS